MVHLCQRVARSAAVALRAGGDPVLHLGNPPGVGGDVRRAMIDGVNDKIAGAHSDLVVKLFADDLTTGREVARLQ